MTRKEQFILKVMAAGILDTKEFRYAAVRSDAGKLIIYRIKLWKLERCADAWMRSNWDIYYEEV